MCYITYFYNYILTIDINLNKNLKYLIIIFFNFTNCENFN